MDALGFVAFASVFLWGRVELGNWNNLWQWQDCGVVLQWHCYIFGCRNDSHLQGTLILVVTYHLLNSWAVVPGNEHVQRSHARGIGYGRWRLLVLCGRLQLFGTGAERCLGYV